MAPSLTVTKLGQVTACDPIAPSSQVPSLVMWFAGPASSHASPGVEVPGSQGPSTWLLDPKSTALVCDPRPLAPLCSPQPQRPQGFQVRSFFSFQKQDAGYVLGQIICKKNMVGTCFFIFDQMPSVSTVSAVPLISFGVIALSYVVITLVPSFMEIELGGVQNSIVIAVTSL